MAGFTTTVLDKFGATRRVLADPLLYNFTFDGVDDSGKFAPITLTGDTSIEVSCRGITDDGIDWSWEMRLVSGNTAGQLVVGIRDGYPIASFINTYDFSSGNIRLTDGQTHILRYDFKFIDSGNSLEVSYFVDGIAAGSGTATLAGRDPTVSEVMRSIDKYTGGGIDWIKIGNERFYNLTGSVRKFVDDKLNPDSAELWNWEAKEYTAATAWATITGTTYANPGIVGGNTYRAKFDIEIDNPVDFTVGGHSFRITKSGKYDLLCFAKVGDDGESKFKARSGSSLPVTLNIKSISVKKTTTMGLYNTSEEDWAEAQGATSAAVRVLGDSTPLNDANKLG